MFNKIARNEIVSQFTDVQFNLFSFLNKFLITNLYIWNTKTNQSLITNTHRNHI